jgi:aspartate kinase
MSADSSFEAGGCSGKSPRGPVVMKFGGTSVEDAPAIRRLVNIVLSRIHESPVVVVSAMADVTDQLLALGTNAKKGELALAHEGARSLRARHLKVVSELVHAERRNALEAWIDAEIHSLEFLLAEVAAAGELSLREQDRLLGFGECLSSRIVTAALLSAGVKVVHIDARHCIVTDDHYGAATPLWQETNQCIMQIVGGQLKVGVVPVLGGFIAATRDGVPTTLGRGGSDLTAAILGAALAATRIEIWTDVDGIMTTDPDVCPDARLVPKISFEEAAQLAYFGAKVLHPATLAPAVRENIPVYVRNSRNPHRACTEITAHHYSSDEVHAIAAKHNVASIEISTVGPIRSELLATVYSVLERNGCSVELMSSAGGRLSMLVSSAKSLPAVAAELNNVAEVRWENHKGLICLVGDNIRHNAELSRRVHSALNDTEVRLLPQAGPGNSVSFLIEESRVHESVQRLHTLFFGMKNSEANFKQSRSLCQAGESWL